MNKLIWLCNWWNFWLKTWHFFFRRQTWNAFVHQSQITGFVVENETSKDIMQDVNSTSRGQVVETKSGEVPNSKSTNPIPVNLLFGMKDIIWHYTDPSGNEQGPFNMVCLRYWMEQGYFDEDFKVWRATQSREDAMSLTDALSLCQ